MEKSENDKSCDKNKKIEVGDVVYLNSSPGFYMTVESIDEKSNTVKAMYFTGKEFETQVLNIDVLTKVEWERKTRYNNRKVFCISILDDSN